MDNIEIVKEVLNIHGCQDAAAIARDAKRIFNYDITNQSAGAAARKLVSIGEAGSSRDGFGKTIYWLTRKGTYKWDKWRNQEEQKMRPREEERKKTPSTSFEHIAQSIYQMYKKTLDNYGTKNIIEVGEHPEIEKCLPITYEKFEETIKAIKEYWDFQNGVYQFGIDMYNIAPDRVVEKTVELLEMIMSDTKNHWISYFLFDLDCGKEFEMGTVILNNKAIPLSTIKDLWNLLLTEMAFSLENSIK